MHAHHKETAILYHGGCPDGFGGAYAAWKKFGNAAEYIPVKHGPAAPAGLAGRKLYFVDFCYPKEMMDALVAEAVSVTVLDHHLGMKEVVESMPEYVFDEKRSGATIAWSYFHPDTPVPQLLKHVEDADLYLFRLPDTRAVISYAYADSFSFEGWDALISQFENPHTRQLMIEKGAIYAEHFAILVEQIANKALLVSFEGFECYLGAAADMFKSDVGNQLVQRKPPIAIVVNFRGDALHVSLRSDSSVDVTTIAQKYGGNGHPRASAFRIAWGNPLPWVVIEKENEDTGN